MKLAIFDLSGATCTGCKIAIESYSKKIEGVEDIYVDGPTNQIQVSFTGDSTEIEEKIPYLVRMLGYNAELSYIGEVDGY